MVEWNSPLKHTHTHTHTPHTHTHTHAGGLTQLAANVPVELGVEVGGVDAIGRGVDAGQLPLVEGQELGGPVVDQGLGPGLAEGQHISWGTWSQITQCQHQCVFCVCVYVCLRVCLCHQMMVMSLHLVCILLPKWRCILFMCKCTSALKSHPVK